MNRERPRRRASSPRAVTPLAPPPAPPASERSWQIAYVAARNAVAVVGVLFFGWSVRNLLLLYFVDTLAGIWAVLVAVSYRITGADVQEGVGDALYGLLTALVAALFLVAVISVPIGVPLVFVLGAPSEASWQAFWTDHSLTRSLVGIALTALVRAGRACIAISRGWAGESQVKRDFAIIFTRWVLIVIAIYPLAALAGRLGSYLLVIVYAAATAWSELAPERLANLVPDRQPP